jgi:hypothetical protein
MRRQQQKHLENQPLRPYRYRLMRKGVEAHNAARLSTMYFKNISDF